MNAEEYGLNAIYGKDNRFFISKNSAPKLIDQSKSVAMIVGQDGLMKTGQNYILNGKSLKEHLNLCPDEKFSKKPSTTACTGFLVKPKVLVTAGHCVLDQNDCLSKKIIFNLLDSSNRLFSSKRLVKANQVFNCKQIIAHGADESMDYSIIELEEDTKDSIPLIVNDSSHGVKPSSVYMLGHPYGLSLMHSQSSIVNDSESMGNDGDLIFKASLDSFEGNSGSPVFNSETHKVEGILINGQDDLFFDSQNKCYRYSVYNGIGGEGILKISNLLPFLN